MKHKVTKKVIFIIIGLFLFLINDNVYAYMKEICSYKGGSFNVYYDTTNDKIEYKYEGRGTIDSPLTSGGRDAAVSDVNFFTGRFDLKKWKFKNDDGTFNCPNIYYKEDGCWYDEETPVIFTVIDKNYRCNVYFAPTAKKKYTEIKPDDSDYVTEHRCIYDDNLIIDYNSDGDNTFATYSTKDYLCEHHVGDEIDPCNRVNEVTDKKGNASSDNRMLDLKYWNFIDEKGNFACPILYHYKICGSNGDKYYCVYNYSPKCNSQLGMDCSEAGITENLVKSSINSVEEEKSSIPINELPICKSNIVSYFIDKVIDENGNEKEIKSPQIKINGFDDVVVTLDDGTTDSFADILTDLEKFFNEKRTFFSNGLSETAYNYYFGKGQLGLTAKINGEAAHFYTRLRKLIKSIDCQMTDEMINQKTYELDRKINNFANDLKAVLLTGIDKSAENGNISEEKAEELRNKTDEVVENFKNNVERFTDVIGSWYGKLMGIEKQTCESILDKDLVTIINRILTWIRIAVPILVIILSSIDFGKAVLSEEKDEMKQAINKLVKRLVVAIIIFFIPTLLHLFVDIYNTTVGSDGIPITPLSKCGIK